MNVMHNSHTDPLSSSNAASPESTSRPVSHTLSASSVQSPELGSGAMHSPNPLKKHAKLRLQIPIEMEKDRDAKSDVATMVKEILRESIVGGNQENIQGQNISMNIPSIESSTLAGILPSAAPPDPLSGDGIDIENSPAPNAEDFCPQPSPPRPPSMQEPAPLSAPTSQFAQNLPSPSTFYPEFYNGGNNELPSPLTFTGQTPTVGRGERGVFQWPMPGNRTVGPSPLKMADPAPSEPSASSEKDSNMGEPKSPQKRGLGELVKEEEGLVPDENTPAKKQKV